MDEMKKLQKQVAELKARVEELESKEKSLLESERRHRLINELISDRIYRFVVGPDGKPELTDPILGTVGDVTGYTIDESRTMSDWVKVVHPDDWETVVESMEQLFSGKQCEMEVRFVSKKGEVTWQHATGLPNWDAQNKRLIDAVVCIKNITLQKRAEQEMLRLERLRAFGQMAAGVSHNLNNILTTIIGPARLLDKELRDPALKQEVGYIIRSARRARDLVRRLNEAVRGGIEMNITAISVNKTVREAVELTHSIWKDEPESRGIEIDVRTELEEVPRTQGTRAGMLDVIVNLLLNAVDALPGGGEIVIRTKAADGGLLLSVSDNGMGMDDKTQKRIFEPFFTTKSEIGTGLGLSTVFGTITRWHGTIEVKSAPGKGTEFLIQLPAFEGEEDSRKEAATGDDSRRGRVLVIEDVESIRSLLSRVLSPKHEVVLVPDGEQALKRFGRGEFDVAVIDLGLSEIPGDRIGRLLRQRDPALATILISGWRLADEDPRTKCFDFKISKPFEDLDRLQKLVADAVRLRDSRASKLA